MHWVSGVVLWLLIWWISLFAVLPIGTHPVENADEATGWRGAPERPRLLFKVIVTTIVATVVFLAVFLVIQSDLISFRHGWFAAPEDQ